jgi:hypothetical protein
MVLDSTRSLFYIFGLLKLFSDIKDLLRQLNIPFIAATRESV